MAKSSTQIDALDMFMQRLNEAKALVAEIQTALDDHLGYDPDAIHWGHAGTMGHIVELLKETAETVKLA